MKKSLILGVSAMLLLVGDLLGQDLTGPAYNYLRDVTVTVAAKQGNLVTDLNIAASRATVYLRDYDLNEITTITETGILAADNWVVQSKGAESEVLQKYELNGTRLVNLASPQTGNLRVAVPVDLGVDRTVWVLGLSSPPNFTTRDTFSARAPSGLGAGLYRHEIKGLATDLVRDAWAQIEYDNNTAIAHKITVYYWNYAGRKWEVFGDTLATPLQAPPNSMGLRFIQAGFGNTTLAVHGLVPATHPKLTIKAVIWNQGPPPVPPAHTTAPGGESGNNGG